MPITLQTIRPNIGAVNGMVTVLM